MEKDNILEQKRSTLMLHVSSKRVVIPTSPSVKRAQQTLY